nr:uncharacterized protein LOC109171666 [Ipomoea batatas]
MAYGTRRWSLKPDLRIVHGLVVGDVSVKWKRKVYGLGGLSLKNELGGWRMVWEDGVSKMNWVDRPTEILPQLYAAPTSSTSTLSLNLQSINEFGKEDHQRSASDIDHRHLHADARIVVIDSDRAGARATITMKNTNHNQGKYKSKNQGKKVGDTSHSNSNQFNVLVDKGDKTWPRHPHYVNRGNPGPSVRGRGCGSVTSRGRGSGRWASTSRAIPPSSGGNSDHGIGNFVFQFGRTAPLVARQNTMGSPPVMAVKVIVQSSPKDDLEESEQPRSGSEPDVNRQDDEESEQPYARFEPDVNTQEVEGNEDSESNDDRNTDSEYSDATYPSPSTRAISYQLTQHLKKLNDAQSQSLRDGKELHITEEDVALTLGFPRGNIIIEKRTKGDEDTTLVEEWKQQLGRTDLSITPTKLCKAMVGCRDGGEWFKRHLAILIATMFVESNSSSYVNTNLIKNFEDVTKIGDLNWVVLYNRPVPRQLPAFKGWTIRLLNQREKNEISFGGFGYNYIDEPQQPLKTIEDKKSAESEEGLQVKSDNLIRDTTAPVDNPNFKEMVESAQKLLGIPNPEIELTQENEEFWNNPEFIAAFDEIDNAIARREQYRTKIVEGPSFSFGMTLDEVDRVIHRVQRTATQSTVKSQQQNVMNDEFNTPSGPSTDTTPNLTQQTTTEDQTQPIEQQENVDENKLQRKNLNSQKQGWKDDKTRIIFKHGAYAVIWDDMLSLNKNEEIKVRSIDAWSAILNQKEKALSNSLPCRFFASTFVCLYTVVAPYGDDALRSNRFSERMDDEIRLIERLNLEDIELFVFSVVHSKHYYVLTINVKNKRFDILDNS